MARKLSQSDPALAIEFFLSGFYTHRSQLFAPFKGIGVNVVSFHDPVIDGQNMEDTDLYEWQRRPGFSVYCSQAMPDTEIVLDFDSFRNELGTVVPVFDSTARLGTFNTTTLTTIVPKTTTNEGFISAVGSGVGTMMYFSDGASADFQKWLSSHPFSTINPSAWGIPAPVTPPVITSQGCWLPFSEKALNNAILDPNGNVEVVTKLYGTSPLTGANEPTWPTTISSTINDGAVQWTNMGPLLSWLPDTFYPLPVVVLDTNGNLQLATNVSPTVNPWNNATNYVVGQVVSFAGLYWAALVNNTGVTPSANYTVTTTSGSMATTQPYWIQTTSPSVTGTYPTSPFVPAWNKTIGATTQDGNYVWTNLGPGVLVESYGTSYVFAYRTIYGHLSTASPISLNTGSIFGPQIATITAFSITGNIVTFTGANNFIPGNVISVSGLQIGTYLNDQSFIVLSSGLSPTQFSAAFTHANVASTLDTGATVNLVASLTGLGTTNVLCNATSSISATEVLDGVVTVFGANNYVPGLWVTFTNVVVASFLNGQQFQIINVDPAGQWFQVSYTTPNGVVPPNQSQTTDSGTVTFNAVEIYRLSDGGGIYLFTGAVTNPVNSGAPPVPYDSGVITAGAGADNGVPGTYVWMNPGNVTSATNYATVAVPAPVGSGPAGFQLVQTCQQWEVGHNVTVQTATFPNPVSSGNSILVFVTIYNIAGSYSVTDNMGNSYSQIAIQDSSNPTGAFNAVFLAKNVSAGTTTVRLAFSGQHTTTFSGFGAAECSGLSGTVGTPASSSNPAGGGDAILNPGSVTTLVNNAVIFTFCWNCTSSAKNQPAQPVILPTGYSAITNQVLLDPIGDNFANTYQQTVCAYQVQSASGTFDPEWGTPSENVSIGITFAMPLNVFTPSDGLVANDFGFAVPQGIGVTGIAVEFDAFFNGTVGDGVYSVQLVKAGIPTGIVYQIQPTNSVQTYTIGGPGFLWGGVWQPSDFNNTTWGVQITASQLTGGINATFSVRNVRVHLTGSSGSTGWVFNDFTTDDDLDELLIAPQSHQNDPPPGAPGSSVTTGGTLTKYWNGRLWMIVGNYVYFSAGPDCTNGVPEEAWPPSYRFQFAGPPIGLEIMSDGLGLLVYLADRVNAIMGGPETISFYPTDWLSNFGISSPNALFRDGSVLGQFTTQGQYFDLMNKDKQETGEHIADYLAANFPPAKTYVTMHRDGEDVGIFISNGFDRVLRFGSNIGAWSVPAFPTFGAGALKSIETSVGVYSLMLAPPNGGISDQIGPQNPASGATAGTAGQIAWTNPGNITLGNPTSYATVSLTTTSFPSGTTLVFDVGATNESTSASSISAGPVTPSGAGEFALFAVSPGFNNQAGPSGGWFQEPNTNLNTMGFIYHIVLPAGSVQPTQTYSSATGTACALALFATTAGTPTVINTYKSPGNTNLLNGANTVSLNSTTAGNSLIVVFLSDQSGNVTFSNVQVTGDTFTRLERATDGVNHIVEIWAANNIVGNSTQLTFNNDNNAASARYCIYEVENISFVGQTSQNLIASNYGPLNLPPATIIKGVQVAVTGKQSAASNVTIQPSTSGGTVHSFNFGTSNTTFTFGGPTDLWGMPWSTPFGITNNGPSFNIQAMITGSVSELPFDAGAATGVIGTPISQPFVIGPVTPSGSADFAMLFVTSFTSATQYANIDAPAGWTQVEISTPGAPNVYTKTGINSPVTLDIEWGGGATSIYSAIGSLVLFQTSGTPTIVQSINGGSELGAGTNNRSFSSNLTAGNTVVLTVSTASATAVQVASVTDTQGNKFQLLETFTTGTVSGLIQQIWTYMAANVVGGADTVNINMSASPGTGLPWLAEISGLAQPTIEFEVSEVKVTIFYQNPGNYIYARDLNSWGDGGMYGQNAGEPYPNCYVTIGSITLSAPGAKLFPLQHVVGYFDAVGNLGGIGESVEGATVPNIFILPNEINSATAAVPWIQLPDAQQEPPEGTNHPSTSLLSLRWPVNSMNLSQASQFIHHLQVKVLFQPENAPNTIKAIAFKEDQE